MCEDQFSLYQCNQFSLYTGQMVAKGSIIWTTYNMVTLKIYFLRFTSKIDSYFWTVESFGECRAHFLWCINGMPLRASCKYIGKTVARSIQSLTVAWGRNLAIEDRSSLCSIVFLVFVKVRFLLCVNDISSLYCRLPRRPPITLRW